jgi:hypothetical protein
LPEKMFLGFGGSEGGNFGGHGGKFSDMGENR